MSVGLDSFWIKPMVPVIGELISYVAKVSMENGLPAAGWAFVPPGPGYQEEA